MDLFDHAARYPAHPGYKASGTSQEAAQAVAGRAHRLRDQVMVILRRHGPKTADEVAALLGESVLSIRPRLSELRQNARIEKTGERRPTASGQAAWVWRVACPSP